MPIVSVLRGRLTLTPLTLTFANQGIGILTHFRSINSNPCRFTKTSDRGLIVTVCWQCSKLAYANFSEMSGFVSLNHCSLSNRKGILRNCPQRLYYLDNSAQPGVTLNNKVS